jgi:hypothetical protein
MTRRRLFVLAVGLGALAAALAVALPAGAASQLNGIFTFSTATNEINAGTPNQGWWSLEDNLLGFNTNPNYVAGRDGVIPGSNHYRNFFTFDITGTTNVCTPSSAVLHVQAAYGNQAGGFGGPPSLAYELFDVTTPALILNDKDLNPSTTIYNDLGGGTALGGPYTLSTSVSHTTVFNLSLNANGLIALRQAKLSHLQYFSIGGAIVPTPSTNQTFLFGNSATPATLTVTYPKLCKVFP